MACTTILVGKNASYDGSTMVARNDDSGSGHFTAKKFVVVQPEEHPAVYRSVISHVEVPLPGHALRMTAMPNAVEGEGIWAAAGVNAAHVGMTATETITSNPRVLGADPLVVYQPAKGERPEVPGGIGVHGHGPLYPLARVSFDDVFRKAVAGKAGRRFEARVVERDGVEDALHQKNAVELFNGHAGRHPGIATVEGAVVLALAAKVGLVAVVALASDKALPPTGVGGVQVKAHGGDISVCSVYGVSPLLIPAADLAQVEASVERQVGVCCCLAVFSRGRIAFGEIAEEIRQGLPHGLLKSAFVQAGTTQHIGVIDAYIQCLLPTRWTTPAQIRAFALQLVEVGIHQGGNDLGGRDIMPHGGPPSARGAGRPADPGPLL